MPPDSVALDLLRKALASWGEAEIHEEGMNEPRTALRIRFARKSFTVRLRHLGREGREGKSSKKEYTVWIVPRGEPDVHERLRKEDESFVDLTGAVRLSLPGLLIDRNDLEPLQDSARWETRNPFSDLASRIPRLLFQAHPQKWSVQGLAQEAGTSGALTSYVVKALVERELIEIEKRGREKMVRLVHPDSLILQWTAEYTWRKNESMAFSASIGDPSRFLKRLPGSLQADDWALTLQAGASLVAPHAMWDSVHIHVGVSSLEDLRRVGVDAGWEPNDKGRVVLMKPHYPNSFLFGSRKKGSLPVVSDLQLILDLWHYPNRGREQAELLLDLHRTR